MVANAADGRHCPHCGMILEEGARFCKKCGGKIEEPEVEMEEEIVEELAAQPRICKGCGEVLEEDAVFCTNCGMKND